MPTRVVVIHRYFWPDTAPYGSLLRAIAEDWAELGDQVRVLTAQPSYTSTGVRRPASERLGRLTVQRLPLLDERRTPLGRLVNFALFPVLCALSLLFGPRPDLVMCSTVPQVLLGRLVCWAARLRGARFVYHCMDLQPEIGRLSGEFATPLVYRAMLRMDRSTMADAAAVVVLSEDMRQAVLRRDPGLESHLVVINNFELPDYEDAPTGEPLLAPPAVGTLRVVFTGNLGRFQRLDEVVRAMGAVTRPVELVFMGEGRAEAQVRSAVTDLPPDSKLQVRMLPHGTPGQAKMLMQSAHVGLVSLRPEVVRYAYPSKTATYLCAGLPVLAYCETDSELARDITDDAIGWAADSPEQLRGAVETVAHCILDEPDDRAAISRHERIADVAGSRFAQQPVLDRWRVLRKDLLSAGNDSRSPAAAEPPVGEVPRSRSDV